jgi:membrane-bound ClpP family serine protease
MTNMLLWAAVILVVGLALAVLEFFIPSGGILAFLSVVAIVTSVVLAFRQGSTPGMVFLAIALLGIPTAFLVAIRIWPNTPMGRRVLLQVPKGDDVLPDHQRLRGMKELVGRVGRTRAVMLPSGPVDFEGDVVSAISEGLSIEEGTLVKVVEVRGNRVVVRPYEGPVQINSVSDSSLSQPIDQITDDPFRHGRLP